MDTGFQIYCNEDDCDRIDPTTYQGLVGELMYIALSTRSDILHSISKLSQCNKHPHKEHYAGLKHIMRYLSDTINLKLCFRKTGKPVEGFVDADWGANIVDVVDVR